MPVTVIGGRCLSFQYQISCSRLELVVHKRKSGDAEFSRADGLKYSDQENIGRWNYNELFLDSGVEAIQFVARKTGVTTDVDYVLVDFVDIDFCFESGDAPVFIFASLSKFYAYILGFSVLLCTLCTIFIINKYIS